MQGFVGCQNWWFLLFVAVNTMSISPAKAADALMQALAAAGCTGNFIIDLIDIKEGEIV